MKKLILTYIQTVSNYTRIWGLGLTATVTEHRLPGPIPTNRPFGQNIYVIELMIEALAKLRALLINLVKDNFLERFEDELKLKFDFLSPLGFAYRADRSYSFMLFCLQYAISFQT